MRFAFILNILTINIFSVFFSLINYMLNSYFCLIFIILSLNILEFEPFTLQIKLQNQKS